MVQFLVDEAALQVVCEMVSLRLAALERMTQMLAVDLDGYYRQLHEARYEMVSILNLVLLVLPAEVEVLCRRALDAQWTVVCRSAESDAV